MTPTDPPPPKASAEPGPPPAKESSKRPGVGGGATYRHPSDHPSVFVQHQAPGYHDGVHDHPLDDELHNPDVAHEHADVNIPALVWSAVALVGVTVVAHVVILVLFGVFESQAAAKQSTVSPLARPVTEMPATTIASPTFNPTADVPGPKLLTDEPMALQQQRSDEAKRLQGYGWVNEKTGIAHMPIEEAKKLLLQRGVPVRADEPPPATLGTRRGAFGEGSGGRAITVPLPDPPTGPTPAPAAKPQGGH
jgi:hypothetical protein